MTEQRPRREQRYRQMDAARITFSNVSRLEDATVSSGYRDHEDIAVAPRRAADA